MGRRDLIRQKAVELVNKLLADTGRDYSTSSDSGLYGYLQRQGYQWNGAEWAGTWPAPAPCGGCSEEAQAPAQTQAPQVQKVNGNGPEYRPVDPATLEPFEKWLLEIKWED